MNNLPSSVEKLIELFSSLPGIGPKSSARLVFHLLHAPKETTEEFSQALLDVKKNVTFCKICNNLAEGDDMCAICLNAGRDENVILVVEDVLDLLAFEKTAQYRGKYHVLGGVISPVLGVGPEDINIGTLMKRIKRNENVEELIIATNPTLEGEATAMYIKDELQNTGKNLKITRIARGVPTGADLDYADRTTLLRALEGRTDL